MTQYILPITTDWHVNDKLALCPPAFHRESGTHYSSQLQSSIYFAWKDYWALVADWKRKLSATVIAPALGDLGDLNKYSPSSLITPITIEVHNAILSVLEPALPIVDHWVIVRGTESHSKAAGELEEWLANDLDNAIRFSSKVASWYVWKAQFHGIRLHMAHTLPSGTKLAGLRGEAVSRSCRYLADECDLANVPKPHLAFWGHRHWYAPGWNRDIQGYALDSWGGLNSFARHIGLSILGHVGGLLLFIPGLDGEAWSIKRFKRKLPQQRIWTPASLEN